MSNDRPRQANGFLLDISLYVLVSWAALCALWNGYGAVQLSKGERALGPTASLPAVGFIVVVAVLLVLARTMRPRVYPWLALLVAVLPALTVWNAFRLDPSLWPSEFWRWAGIVLNGSGVGGAILAVIASLDRGMSSR